MIINVKHDHNKFEPYYINDERIQFIPTPGMHWNEYVVKNVEIKTAPLFDNHHTFTSITIIVWD